MFVCMPLQTKQPVRVFFGDPTRWCMSLQPVARFTAFSSFRFASHGAHPAFHGRARIGLMSQGIQEHIYWTSIVWAKMKTFNHDESYHSNILFRLWRQTFLIVLVTVLGFKWNRSYLCLVRMSQNIQPLLWKIWAFNYSFWRSYHGTLGVPFSWEQAWAAWRPSNSAGLHVQVLGISTVCVYVYHVC